MPVKDFEDAWAYGSAGFWALAFGPVVAPGIPTSPSPAPSAVPSPPRVVPGGTWISPDEGTLTGPGIHFAAHAYQTTSGDPTIDHVNFTVWWAALGPKDGPWKVACVGYPSLGGDTFQCDANLSQLGAPPGALGVSFDVYDKAGNKNLSPNGLHNLKWTQPTPTLAQAAIPNGWRTFRSSALGYSLALPPNWQWHPGTVAEPLFGSLKLDMADWSARADAIERQATLQVGSQKVEASMTASDYVENLLKTLIPAPIPGASQSVQSVSVGGRDGRAIIFIGPGFRAPAAFSAVFQEEVYVVVADRLYLFRFSVNQTQSVDFMTDAPGLEAFQKLSEAFSSQERGNIAQIIGAIRFS